MSEQLIADLRRDASRVRCSIAMEQNIHKICDELTAAQQRVAELERENAELKRSLDWHKMQLERDRARLQEIRESYKHPYDE